MKRARRMTNASRALRRLSIELLETRTVFSSAPFLMAVLPDTQYYTQSYPQIFDAQTQWIIDNQASRNIQFVTHVGDIVQSAEQGTNQNQLQWQRADSSMDRLDGNLAAQLDGKIPYSVALGNHDYAVVSDKTSGSSRYQQYFGPSRYEGRSWYLEDSGLRGAHAQIFEAGGYRFLHITMQFESLDEDHAWAQGVIDRNPGLPTILTTHSYLNPSAQARQDTIQGDRNGVPNQGNTGEQVFQKFVFDNPSIFLVVNGHFTGEFTQISTNRAGQPVIEMVTDYQGLANGGDGWMRLLEFRPNDNRIDFNTYSPTRNEYQTDANSQFTLPLNFVERFGAPIATGQNVSTYQNGRVVSNVVYNGTVDTQIREQSPTTAYGSSTSEVLVDAPSLGSNNTSHALLKFTGLIGNGNGQIPIGSQILSAKLIVNSINPGAGAKIHRLLAAWDGTTTWNSWNGGIQANNLEALSVLSAQLGTAALTPVVPIENELTIDVTNDVHSWVAGAINHGWAFLPWNNGTDGWAFSPSEVTSLGDRPSLQIEWLPPSIGNTPTSVVASNIPTAFTENSAPIPLFPSAMVFDSDSINFDDGRIRVDITMNAVMEDQIIVVHQGNAAGQIGVSAGVITYGGIVIGQVSDGLGPKPLTISLNSNATLEAVQALVRSIAYKNISESPSTLVRTVRMFVFDGDGGVSNQVGKSINVTTTNDAPFIQPSIPTVYYLAGGGPTRLDAFATLTDLDSNDLNGGSLTFSISENGLAEDSLSVRSEGNAAGQIGVVGNSISYSGMVIGTFSGGTNGSPLVISLLANSNAVSAQSLIRAIVFQTTDQRLVPASRTITLISNDGDGGMEGTAIWKLEQSLVRRYRFQEGVDSGLGTYVGSNDTQLRESSPSTAYPEGSTPADGLLVDYDSTSASSQALLRFDNIFGSGTGKVPFGATIVAARLVLDVNNPGDGASLHRLLTAWNAQTETWNSFGNSVSPRNNLGGVQANNTEARSEYRAQVGTAFGTGDADEGTTVIGVTSDVQAWASGQSNFGWLLKAWEGFTNGFAFSSSEASHPLNRPALEIDWLPSTIAGASFQQGVNGYLGTVDTELEQDFPTRNNSTSNVLFVDDNSLDPLNPTQQLPDQSEVLLRFDQLNGTLANQIPAGSLIHSAVLTLASNTNDAPGQGGEFHRMLEAWSASSTWNSLVGGVDANGTEAVQGATVLAGNSPHAPDIEGGWNSWDVTADVQAWTTNSSTNHGWAILPVQGGTNGWGIQSSEAANIVERPELRVFYTPLGVSVTPTTGLITTELGGSTTFSIVLNTPPTADVTFGLSSSKPTEGITSLSSVTFNHSNWYIPRTISVTGIDDFSVDGNASYQVVISSAISLDSNYHGFDPVDVSLTNTGNGLINIASVVNRRVFYNGGSGGATGFGASTNFAATGGNPPATAIDSKVALLPGQNSSFANYTNASFGLNGIIVDIANPTGTITAADFTFAKGETLSQAGFVAFTATELSTTIVPVVTEFVGGGVSGSTRAKITLNNNSLKNTWVKVTVLANANTGLAANDVFYFGNVVGDTQGSVTGGRYTVNSIDTSGARNNQSSVPNSVLVTNIYDFNKTGNVNALDTSVVRTYQQASGFVKVISGAPAMFVGDDIPGIDSQDDLDESGPLLREVSSIVRSTRVGQASSTVAGRVSPDEDVANFFAEEIAYAKVYNSTYESIDDFFSEFGTEFKT